MRRKKNTDEMVQPSLGIGFVLQDRLHEMDSPPVVAVDKVVQHLRKMRHPMSAAEIKL